MAIVDDTGHPLSDDEALLVLLTLVTEANPSARVALPVAASRAAEEAVAIVEQVGAVDSAAAVSPFTKPV